MSTKEQNIPKKIINVENSDISICDLTKNNTSEILQRMEYQVPIFLQSYTDLFTKYLHSFNSAFGTCRLAERQFFDRFEIDHKIMNEFAEYWNFIKNLSLIQIDLSSKFLEDYVEFRISTVESFDKFMTSAFEYYSKALSEFNKK